MMLAHPSLDSLRRHSLNKEDEPNGRHVQVHLQTCGRCQETLEWSHSVVKASRAATELRAPAGAWDQVARRLADGDTVVLPVAYEAVTSPARLHRVPNASRTARRAAVLLLALAGTAAAMVPGSPVREWLAKSAGETGGTAAPVPEAPMEAPPSTAGFVIPTGESPVIVSFHTPDAALVLRVRTGPPGELSIQAFGAAAGAQFGRGRSRLDITNAGPGEVLLVLPGSGGEVRVELDGRPVMWQEAGRLVLPAPVPDTAGSELLIRMGDVAAEETVR